MSPEQRALHEAIQGAVNYDDDLEGSLLVGWVLVAEWASPDGVRRLTRIDGPDVRGWQRKGYLHEALDDGWED